MTDIKAAQDNAPNPANDANAVAEDWVPMSTPQARLQVPQRAGYYRHWFRNEPGRIERAQRAGYTFVDAADANMASRGLGGTPEDGGSTDLGSRVSVAAGGYGDNGQALRLYLMECPIAIYKKGRMAADSVVDATVESLAAGRTPNAANGANTYTKGNLPKLFTKKSSPVEY